MGLNSTYEPAGFPGIRNSDFKPIFCFAILIFHKVIMFYLNRVVLQRSDSHFPCFVESLQQSVRISNGHLHPYNKVWSCHSVATLRGTSFQNLS
jgi:hypothetical protein